jgi:hypothetical protein
VGEKRSRSLATKFLRFFSPSFDLLDPLRSVVASPINSGEVWGKARLACDPGSARGSSGRAGRRSMVLPGSLQVSGSARSSP